MVAGLARANRVILRCFCPLIINRSAVNIDHVARQADRRASHSPVYPARMAA